jgi:hypothetical protein
LYSEGSSENKLTISYEPPIPVGRFNIGVPVNRHWLGRFKKAKKLMLIGGGEIGTEISLAALRQGKPGRAGTRWLIRAIIDDSTSPIRNLLFYLEGSAEDEGSVEDCQVPAFTNDRSKKFQFLVQKRTQDSESYIQFIAQCIRTERPHVVLLEDEFLTDKEWKELYRVLKDSGYFTKNRTHFFPSPTFEVRTLHKTFLQSDIFLNKATMKEFLESEFDDLRSLGTSNDKVKIESLERELAGEQQPDKPVQRILKALKEKGTLIFKLPMSSSGRGQFILTSADELTADCLAKMKAFERAGVSNDYYLFERYVANRTETCIIMGQCEDKRNCLDSIYYTKYDPERYPSDQKYSIKDLHGTFHLLQSETCVGKCLLVQKLRDISSRIQRKLHASFIYVEFIIDATGPDIETTNAIYVNEITYRPDDAGFISRIAHEKSEFELFVDCMERTIASEKMRIYDAEVLNPLGEYCSFSLIPDRHINFTKDILNQEQGEKSNQVKFRLYEKRLRDAESKTLFPNRKIIGYLMHHKNEDATEILKTRLRHLGMSDDTILILVKALESTKEQIRKSSARTGKASRHQKSLKEYSN